MKGINWLTVLLFGYGGYSLGSVLDQSGLSGLIYQKVPGAKMIADNAYSNGFRGGTGAALTKAGGVAAFIHSLYESRHGTIPKHVMNAELPLALGMMADPSTQGSASADYWSG